MENMFDKLIKLKDNVDFTELEEYGFVEDPANCCLGESYYGSNNYYFQNSKGNFRIVINEHTRVINIATLVNESGLFEMHQLEPLFLLIKNDLVEFAI